MNKADVICKDLNMISNNIRSALFDAYGQGKSDGYDKGYADGSLSVTEEIKEHWYQQGKADAILEMRKILNSKHAIIQYSEKTDWNSITMFSKDSNWLAEQLKEQNE